MTFDELTLEQLKAREVVLIGEITQSSADTRGEVRKPIEQEFTFDLTPRKTKRGKLFPKHRYTVKLKSPDDFDAAWDAAVNSFKRRFNKRKTWVTAEGENISPKRHNQRFAAGITTDRVEFVDRWNDRAWNAIMVGLEPSESDRRQIKQLTFADVKKIEDLTKEIKGKRNELTRIRGEIDRRERAAEYLKNWSARVTEDFTEEELRRMSQKQLYARFGLKSSDINYAKSFKKGEIGLSQILDRIKTYYKVS